MNMKILSLCFMIVLITGCSSGNSFTGGGNSPSETAAKKAFEDMVNYALNADAFKFFGKIYGAENKIQELNNVEEKFGSAQVANVGKTFKNIFKQVTFKIINTEVISDEQVNLNVNIKMKSISETSVFEVYFINGDWKVELTGTPIEIK